VCRIKTRSRLRGFRLRGIPGRGWCRARRGGIRDGAAGGAAAFFALPRWSRDVCVGTLAVSILEASGAGVGEGKAQVRRWRVGLLVQC